MTIEDRTVGSGQLPQLRVEAGETTIDLRGGESGDSRGADDTTGRPPHERRRPTQGTRVSWAQSRPFVETAEASVEDLALVDDVVPTPLGSRSDAAWRRAYGVRSLVGDLAVFAVVLTSVLVTLPLDLRTTASVAAAATAGWGLSLLVNRAYDSRRFGSGPEEFQSVMRATWLVVAGLAIAAYTLKADVPRRVVFVAVPLAGVLVAVHRYLQRRLLNAERARGLSMQRTLVVGDADEVDRVTADLGGNRHHGFEVVGACVPRWSPHGVDGLSVPVMGAVGDVAQVVVDQSIDVVIVVGSELRGQSLRRLSWALDRVGAELVVSPGVMEVAGPHVSVRPAAGLSLLHLEQPSRNLGRELGKSVLDRVLGGGLLLAASGPLLVMAAAVALTSPGGAFFRQTRAGVDGKPFTMYKLRTMVADAEARRDELLGDSDRDGLMFKMHADPRVTPVGKVLRRLSLDELPQLWNVVKGDMSLVGPRPPLPTEVAQYHDHVNRRLRVRPGLTGLWQVSGRADLDWDQSVNLDLRYVDNWSLALDLQILWKTARAVLKGSGAY